MQILSVCIARYPGHLLRMLDNKNALNSRPVTQQQPQNYKSNMHSTIHSCISPIVSDRFYGSAMSATGPQFLQTIVRSCALSNGDFTTNGDTHCQIEAIFSFMDFFPFIANASLFSCYDIWHGHFLLNKISTECSFRLRGQFIKICVQ